MKMGLTYQQAINMSEVEALGWLEAYLETKGKGAKAETSKTYRVRRDRKG